MEILAWVSGSGFVIGVIGFFLFFCNTRWLTPNLSWEEVGAYMWILGIVSWIACIPLAIILSATGNL